MSAYIKKQKVPETLIGEEGSAKRNILRKGGPVSSRKGHVTGQTVDDGSTSVVPPALDEKDPNYDSEDDSGYQNIPRISALSREEIGRSSITLPVYKRSIESIIAEFFVNGDIDNAGRSLQDIGAPEYSYEFVKRLMNKSFDKSDRERESVSQLLSNLYPNILSSNMIGKGFERLFELIDEIEKDAPAARAELSTFLARAVIDEVVPPSFLSDSVVCNLGGDVVEQAKLLLSRDHAGAKLERIWGPGDGRPVEEMKVAVDQLVQEFLLSDDLEEATRCIVELNSPFFFHEVVKRSVVNAIDKPTNEQLKISKLLAHLYKSELLSQQQTVKGFERLFTLLPDLVLDTPAAEKILQGFHDRAKSDGILPKSFSQIPSM